MGVDHQDAGAPPVEPDAAVDSDDQGSSPASGRRPGILVTMGDPAGVGPEIALKAIREQSIAGRFEVRIVGAPQALEWWSNHLSLDLDVELKDCGVEAGAIRPGRPTDQGARAALESVVEAARLCQSGEAQAMVTCPVSKAAIQRAGYDFPGHTEFLADLTSSGAFIMTFVRGTRRVALVTTHLPLRDVAGALSIELVVEKLRVLNEGLTRSFGVDGPRIAVTGLNPHAGEEGRLGDEEELIIAPAIATAVEVGIRAEGPFPADTIYIGLGEPEGTGPGSGFDAVLAMYHDQGTVAAKLGGTGGGVNVTLGLPVVRTSVDHGTAFDIAGHGIADVASMVAAIELAGEIAARRGPSGA